MKLVYFILGFILFFGCISNGQIKEKIKPFNRTIQNQTPQTNLANNTLTRKVLAILWDPKRSTDPAPNKSAVEQILFGNAPSVKDYFSKVSNGKFAIEKADLLGWYNSDYPASYYWSPYDPNDLDGDGWQSRHTLKWAEAIRKASKEFNFSKYDINRDGTLTPDELGILIVIPQNEPFGVNRPVYSREYPVPEPLIVDGLRMTTIAEVYIGSPVNLGVGAHELSHLFWNMPDMYYPFFFPYAAGAYSLMDNAYTTNYIDPYNRLRAGWIEPVNITTSGTYLINSTADGGSVYALYSKSRGIQEYFLIENRQRETYYDSQLQDSGIAIWDIIEDQNIFGNLPAPSGVSTASWNSIPKDEWGRRGIRMIRPGYYPFDDSKALWKNASDRSQFIRLTWADGSDSGFTLSNFSNSGKQMEFTIKMD